ncbi:hypothetical protein CP532_0677 [Ophiocordyceps camponoti-leonardi (nom. inval.)]|nr:hypothetical protein CP532_0677 [Ophiocordyceps camponoti-leonardi (nom. inval.)]
MTDAVQGPAPVEISSSASKGVEGGNKFQDAISAWRNVDLTNLTANLDNTASEIVTYQRDSTVQRKDLAQKTKEFKKLDDASKLVEIKGLLKAYQTFIDLLTTHSKSVNSAFLQAYTSISEAPDPYPLLEASVDSMLVTEETLPRITEENQRLQENVARLTTQLGEAESKLQVERVARKESEDTLEARVKGVESSWSAVLDEKKDNWEARERSLEEKLENQDRLLNEMRASYEVNQRLGLSGEHSDTPRATASSAELEMLHSELERTSSRLAEVEARNEQMRLELAHAKSSLSSQPQKSLEDDPDYMRVRTENSSLIRKLEAARMDKENTKRELDTRLHSMEREAQLLKEERMLLKSKIQKWSDYDDIKQELEVLKSIEFSTGDDDEARDKAEKGAESGDTLEKLLLSRNKKLSEELTILRVSHQDLNSRLASIQEELSGTKEELEKAQKLNEKLESDLANMQAEGASAFPSGASVAGTYVTRAPTRRGKISPTSSIISGMDPRMSQEPMGGGSGILPMVTAQRDRFKKKIAQLEQDLSEAHKTVRQLRQEVAALQKDNLNLYEKTRYVSTYNRGGATASAYAANPNPSTISIGNPNVSLDRYRKAYESNLSPFAAFRGRESARAYRRMSFPERVVYSVTRMVLASRASRNLFAAYCVALHVVVFFSLYWLGSTDVEKHGSNFGSAAAAAAAAAAGRGGGQVGPMAGGTALSLAWAVTASAAPAPARVGTQYDDDAFDSLAAYFKVIAAGMQQAQLLSGFSNCDLSRAQMPSGLYGLPAPEEGLTVRHVAVGRGTQNYTCSGPSSSAPVAAGAVAKLFDASCLAVLYPNLLERIPAMAVLLDAGNEEQGQPGGTSSVLEESGVHFFTDRSTAYFDLDTSTRDLGKAPCSKVNSAEAPATAARGRRGEKAVAWLQLRAKDGATDGIKQVYRLATAGGSAPATCEGMPASFEVPYAAV